MDLKKTAKQIIAAIIKMMVSIYCVCMWMVSQKDALSFSIPG